MARMRSIKPEFWADEDLAVLPRDARLLYVGLWNLSDEHGRLRGDPRYIKGQLFPYDDDLTAKDVDALLDALALARKVLRYRVGGVQSVGTTPGQRPDNGMPRIDAGNYLFLPNLDKHQRLDADKVPSRLPPPPAMPWPESSAFWCGKFPDESERGGDSPEDVEARARASFKHVAGSRLHVAGGDSQTGPRIAAAKRGTRVPDDFEPSAELIAWAREKAPTTDRSDHEAFMDHWRATPGQRGTKADWDATWRSWMRREHKQRSANGARASPARESTTDRRVNDALLLKAQFRQEAIDP